jgi:serine/threonine-protein kinase
MTIIRMLLLILAPFGLMLATALYLTALAFGLRFALLDPEMERWAVELGAAGLYRLTDPVLAQLAQSMPLAWPPEIPIDAALPLVPAAACLALAVVTTLLTGYTYRVAEGRRQPRGAAQPIAAVAVASLGAGPTAPLALRTPSQRLPESTAGLPVRPGPVGETMVNAAPGLFMIGRYELIGELGRGAMGVVYKARDPAFDRLVAMKTYVAGQGADDEFRQRFEREARAAGKLSHPGIVTAYDLVKDASGQPYMVMEFVDGSTLTRMLAGEQVSFGRAVEIGVQLALALDYAHSCGLVHRDIKPDNVIVGTDGRARIMDFGIARVRGRDLTQAGQILGTPSFMAPEQFLSSRVDSRADLFSLGSTLYWMFTGQKPFPGANLVTVADRIATSEAPAPSTLKSGLPDGVDRILKKCMAKKPEDRYQTARELATNLMLLKSGEE